MAEETEAVVPENDAEEPVELSDDDQQQAEEEVEVDVEGYPQEQEEDIPHDEEKKTNWIKDLRKSFKETARENKELKRKMEELQKPKVEKIDPIEEPTLEDCDYDTDLFRQKFKAWHARSLELEAQKARQEEQERAQAKSWQSRLEAYEAGKKTLKTHDYGLAENTVKALFSTVQQGILLKGAKDPALLVYAIGKNEQLAEKLAKISDPVEFAFEVARVEAGVKVLPRKQGLPEPERKVSGRGRIEPVDATLEKLREAAAKSGDISAVIAYKQQQKQKRGV